MSTIDRAALRLGIIVDALRRADRDERGQTALEYVGILLIVGAIIAMIVAAGIPEQVRDRVAEALADVFGGGD